MWKRRKRESPRLGRAAVAELPKLCSIRTLSTAITDSDLNRLTVENLMAHEIVDPASGMAELWCSEGLRVFGSLLWLICSWSWLQSWADSLHGGESTKEKSTMHHAKAQQTEIPIEESQGLNSHA